MHVGASVLRRGPNFVAPNILNFEVTFSGYVCLPYSPLSHVLGLEG